ncbi:MAG: response regulator [Prolixibacteraceae bacterium]|jgi:signal transduction histidine kinase/ligand-binding sensor domain-containing protein/DNA-binding response OmpR family regulator|nr:response regulator [Prolixibacteraceae bacterium]
MRYCLTLFIVILSFGAWANPRFTFDRLTIEDGLANNSVRTIFQDNEGYLWFGTLNGLSRYDGQQFKTFDYKASDSTSISNNKIRDIFQDGEGFLWVTTYDNNAHRFDPKTETFINFPVVLGDEYIDCSVHFLYESTPGVMWMYISGNGCVRLTPSNEPAGYSLKWFSTNNVLASDNLNTVWKDRQNGIWISTFRGTSYLPNGNSNGNDCYDDVKHYFMGAETAIVSFCESDNAVWAGMQSGDIYKITPDTVSLEWTMPPRNKVLRGVRMMEVDNDGNIYVATEMGLLIINPETGTQKHYMESNSTLNSNYIMSFYFDTYGDCWLATNNRGVTRFQVENETFTHYPLNPSIRQSILEGEKQVFLEDNTGNLWVGIYGGGISRFDRETASFHQYLHEENNPASLSSNLILSLAKDRSGNLWTGTFKRGVNRINLHEDNFNLMKNSSEAERDFLNEMRAVFEDSRQWIWAGDKRGKIAVYDQNFNKLFEPSKYFSKLNIATGVYAFEEDENNNIWIGTKGEGIFVLTNLPGDLRNLTENNVRVYQFSSSEPPEFKLTHKDVFDLHYDSHGQMWVALYHGGVNVIRHALTPQQEILKYDTDDSRPETLSDERVRCILEDHAGNIWIGTAFGLNYVPSQYVETEDKRFVTIARGDNNQSLSYNDVFCLFQDSDERIWIGTSGGGMNRLVERESGSSNFEFEKVQHSDGLSSNMVLSIVEDHNKTLWISTDFGLNKMVLNSGNIEKYYIADGLDEDSFSEGPGLLTSDNKMIFGHISGMAWFAPDSITKSGHLVPVVLTNLKINGATNKEFMNSARRILGDSLRALALKYNENFVTFEFAALDYKAPSKIQYSFKLEGFEPGWNNSGNLNTAIYRELPPGDYVFRLRASNSDGLWVNPEMKLNLSISPPPWRTTWAYSLYLIFSLGLFFLLQRFIMERVKLKHEVQYEKHLADDKLKFYTSISHEFKTPLSLILGPVEDVLAKKKLPSDVTSSLEMVKRNTKRMQELIDQLMDFRKIQKGFMKSEIYTGDMVLFLKEIYRVFKPLSKRQQIRFSFICPVDELKLNYDYQSLEKIVFNLLSNAFKHTGPGKEISLEVEANQSGDFFAISVRDEGEGIPENDMPHIFERFYPGNRSRLKEESSTGIGLSLCSELVEILGGTIDVDSRRGYGSCFKVMLPIKKQNRASGSTESTDPDLYYTHKYIDVAEKHTIATMPDSGTIQINGKETLLIVEDNPDLQKFLFDHLSSKYHVLQAYNGVQGLQIANNENPELIICDIMMPEMDGLELTRILKSEFHTCHIPIILLTAKSHEAHKIEGIETGADDYIVKPFNMVYLEKRLENILIQRKKLREKFKQNVEMKPQELSSARVDQEFIDKVTALVEENMSNAEFSVDLLISHFNFGRTIFYKKIKGVTGYAPKDYIRIIRMKKAADLLLQNDITVAEVAYDTGYNDPNYFSKLFKKHFGIAPVDYQKKNRSV